MTNPNSLEAFILNPIHVADTEHIRQCNLEAFAFRHLSSIYQTPFREAYLQASLRHQLIKRELLPLLQAWADAGLQVLIFKGFYLAECIYDDPAERFYGDVDILIHREDLPMLSKIAEDLGWEYEEVADKTKHESAHFYSPQNNVRIDAHHYIIHQFGPNDTRQKQLTQFIWQTATPIYLEKTLVYTLQGIDHLLIGLVLNRCWSEWGVKSNDYLDFDYLVKHFNLSQSQILQRAQELKISKTLECYLKLCNPFRQTLHLGKLSLTKRLINNFFISKECKSGLERVITRLKRIPRYLTDLIYYFLEVLCTLRALQTTQNLHQLVSDMNMQSTYPPISSADKVRMIRAVQYLSKLLTPKGTGICVVRALTLFKLLRQHGEEVSFISGVKKSSSGIVGHAWIELRGRPINIANDKLARKYYEVIFQYP